MENGNILPYGCETFALGKSLPQSFYNSEQLYGIEIQKIFSRHWLCVGHSSRIQNPGDYFLVRLDKESIIVVRDREGNINCFYNVCRHRGSQLLDKPEGHVGGRLVCPYHAWSYDLGGELRSALSMPSCFDTHNHGLKRIALQVHCGLIFICLAEEPEFDLNKDIAPILPFLEFAGLADAKVAARKVFHEACNWKAATENNVECYHCTPAHQVFVKNFTKSFVHAYGRDPGSEGCTEAEAEHIAWEAKARAAGHLTGAYASDTATGVAYSMARVPFREGSLSSTIGGQPASRVLMGQATQHDGGWTGGDFSTFFIILANIDHLLTWRTLPLSVDQTEVEMTWFVAKDAQEGRDYDPAMVMAMWDHTFQEDVIITERNQRGILSRAYEPGTLSLHEAPVLAFHSWYAQQMGIVTN